MSEEFFDRYLVSPDVESANKAFDAVNTANKSGLSPEMALYWLRGMKELYGDKPSPYMVGEKSKAGPNV